MEQLQMIAIWDLVETALGIAATTVLCLWFLNWLTGDKSERTAREIWDLIEQLECGESIELRRKAACNLALYGPEAAEATLALADVLTTNGDVRLRCLAAIALDQIGPGSAEARWALEAALTDANPAVSGIALALRSIEA
jgi:HEAT repeat protein